MRKKVDIYTDGACSGNPGIGGYCAILLYKDKEKIISDSFENTTNNRMEIIAVIEGLKALKEDCSVTIYSDSAYVVNAFKQNWVDDWQKNNYRKSDNKEISNKELWIELLELTKKHKVNFIKVKGHSDNAYNNKCDMIATGEIKRFKERNQI